MQIKEYEAFTLKDCLQLVRDDLGPEAVILETRKFRKGGLLGFGAREAVCIVAATGITVQNDLSETPRPAEKKAAPAAARNGATAVAERPEIVTNRTASASPSASQAAAIAAARSAYTRTPASMSPPAAAPVSSASNALAPTAARPAPPRVPLAVEPGGKETERIAYLEKAMEEIREGLKSLRKEQESAHERTLSAVVSAVAPVTNAVHLAFPNEDRPTRFPELYRKMRDSDVSDTLARELLDELPSLDGWNEEAKIPMAESALRDLISRRILPGGPIVLTPGQLKAVALIGPTGVGKTTTIAKLAAHFSLVEGKKVALLTVDTYRIAAVEQLKTYSQIIDIPIGVAYNQAEVLPAVAGFADFDLLLIDTAGRSQKNIMQVGELKALLESVRCETHLVLSAHVKEQDLLEAAQRFSAARVDRLLFSKLDETNTYGTLLNVADKTGIPLSYLTTGQKVPEDIETADGKRFAELILG